LKCDLKLFKQNLSEGIMNPKTWPSILMRRSSAPSSTKKDNGNFLDLFPGHEHEEQRLCC